MISAQRAGDTNRPEYTNHDSQAVEKAKRRENYLGRLGKEDETQPAQRDAKYGLTRDRVCGNRRPADMFFLFESG